MQMKGYVSRLAEIRTAIEAIVKLPVTVVSEVIPDGDASLPGVGAPYKPPINFSSKGGGYFSKSKLSGPMGFRISSSN